MGGKHCEKTRNCSLRAISSFPIVFKQTCTADTLKPGLVWEKVKIPLPPVKRSKEIGLMNEYYSNPIFQMLQGKRKAPLRFFKEKERERERYSNRLHPDNKFTLCCAGCGPFLKF